jgi:hypothetical protein
MTITAPHFFENHSVSKWLVKHLKYIDYDVYCVQNIFDVNTGQFFLYRVRLNAVQFVSTGCVCMLFSLFVQGAFECCAVCLYKMYLNTVQFVCSRCIWMLCSLFVQGAFACCAVRMYRMCLTLCIRKHSVTQHIYSHYQIHLLWRTVQYNAFSLWGLRSKFLLHTPWNLLIIIM